MQIQNVRLGFATNSSSSHSVILLPKNQLPKQDEDVETGQYGWNDFVLVSQDEKMNYFAAQLGEVLKLQLGNELTQIVLREFAGVTWDSEWYVDHQSQITFPVTREDYVDFEFVKALKELFNRSDVVVYGGNDNVIDDAWDRMHSHAEQNILGEITDLRSGQHWAMRTGKTWTLFNFVTGAKIRLSFDGSKVYRSSAPELVDMHLTDFCPFNCAFCYQGSTAEGKHADRRDVFNYLYQLQDMGTFEVTFGGGEPTLYPDFEAALKHARFLGIVPNFTSKIRPTRWPYSLVETVKENVGGFAVSVADSGEIYNVQADAEKLGLQNKAHIHYVVGTGNYYQLEAVISACEHVRLPLTLLGFKTTGRGKSYAPKADAIRTESLNKTGRVSVDTAFVEQYQHLLDEQSVSNLLVTEGEGRFSMYVDAVNKKAGISSYHPDTMLEIDEDLQETWHKLGEFVK